MKDTHDSFYMELIQDVSKKQIGIINNILRCGDLVIMLASNDIKIIKHVPNPDFHFRLMNRVRQKYCHQNVDQNDNRTHQGTENMMRPAIKDEELQGDDQKTVEDLELTSFGKPKK